MVSLIQEGTAKIEATQQSIVSKKMPVFYNPVMKFNRDCSLWLLRALRVKKCRIVLPLCGTGIRGIRFILELPKTALGEIYFNDISPTAIKQVKKNVKRNKIQITNKIHFSCTEGNLFLRSNKPFDYIDIDPFGSPNPFLDSAIARLSKNGVLAVTATDTAALCGTAERACHRKYWALPLHGELMHEIGLRILIRKVQLIGMHYEKALVPILSYSRDHYMRAFFICKKGNDTVEMLWRHHQMFKGAGPLWTGPLHDTGIVQRMARLSKDPFLEVIAEESTLPLVGFYDLHELCSTHKISSLPKLTEIISQIQKTHPAVRTHFCPWGMKSTIPEEKLIGLLQFNAMP